MPIDKSTSHRQEEGEGGMTAKELAQENGRAPCLRSCLLQETKLQTTLYNGTTIIAQLASRGAKFALQPQRFYVLTPSRPFP